MRIRLLKKVEKNVTIQFDLQKLKDPEVVDIFKAEISEKLPAFNLIDNDIYGMS